MMPRFQNGEFQYGLESTLGASYRQAAYIGEALSTAGRVIDGDADSWVGEWTATAGAAWAAGVRARRAGRRVSALAYFMRAATYYGAALGQITRSSESGRRPDLWRRQRACWEEILDLSPVPGQRIEIAYEDTSLPGFFFPAVGASGRARPLVVVNNGCHQTTAEMWVRAGAGAAERGYHWLTFDGPGQQSALFERRIFFRSDWEAVLTPVLDASLARPDVDRDRVAVIGVGQGGYWVARALAFEHRFAAAVVDPGIVDVSTAWIDRLPRRMREQLNDRRRSAFDREMHLAELFAPASTQTLQFHGEPYGHDGGSAFHLFQNVATYLLGEEVQGIDTPLLITESEGEQFWPGQSRQLHDRLPGPREFVSFTTHEGAGGHCAPLAQALREARIFDWLDTYLGGLDPVVQ
jgi:hypothetical protein